MNNEKIKGETQDCDDSGSSVCYPSKFAAAKDYNSGLRKALFMESPDGFKWDDCSALFMAGYEFGKALKPMVRENRNAHFRDHGIEEIAIVTVQDG